MKTNCRPIRAFLSSVLILFIIPSCNAATTELASSGSIPEEHNKAVVLEYFQQMLDGKQYNLMPEVFTSDVIMHRPEGILANLYVIQPVFVAAFSSQTIETTLHEMVASEDYVAVRLS